MMVEVPFARKMTLTPFRRAGRIDIDRLSAAHATAAPVALREFAPASPRGRAGLRRVGQHLERQRLQRVAGQDRGGFVEGDVHGGLAAAQGVVVHRRQVVVHQRIAVDQFDRDGGGIQRRHVRAEGVAGGVGQQRTHALAAIEHAVAHRRVQAVAGREWRVAGRRRGRLRCARARPRMPPQASSTASKGRALVGLGRVAEQAHAQFGLLQRRLATRYRPDAAFVGGQGFLQGHLARFHPVDEIFERLHRLLEVGDGRTVFGRGGGFLGHGASLRHRDPAQRMRRAPSHAAMRAERMASPTASSASSAVG